MTGPLHGTTVVEFSDYVTGPYATALLADMGARVIKIEAPGRGDPFRGWGPDAYSPTFRSINRSKESVTLNLKSERGQAVARALVMRADAFVENHRPGVAEKVGLGYGQVSALNPRLVYCAISGFGDDGPYRDWPGYDTVGQALSGLLSLLTDWQDPRGMGVSLSDHLTGLFAAYGVLGALVQQARTGEGQRVETSLLSATTSFLAENAVRFLEDGVVPDREHRTHLAQVYAFVTQDNLPIVIHLSSPQKFFEGLTRAIGQPELLTDPRFADRGARVKNYQALNEILRQAMASAPRAVWLQRLRAMDVPAAPINTLAEVLADPQVQHLGLIKTVVHPTFGAMQLMGSGVRWSRAPDGAIGAPPLLGEHTESVLNELGYDAATIQRLRDEEVL